MICYLHGINLTLTVTCIVFPIDHESYPSFTIFKMYRPTAYLNT